MSELRSLVKRRMVGGGRLIVTQVWTLPVCAFSLNASGVSLSREILQGCTLDTYLLFLVSFLGSPPPSQLLGERWARCCEFQIHFEAPSLPPAQSRIRKVHSDA